MLRRKKNQPNDTANGNHLANFIGKKISSSLKAIAAPALAAISGAALTAGVSTASVAVAGVSPAARALAVGLDEAIKRKRGRPKMTEEQKAATRAKRELGKTKRFSIGEEPNQRTRGNRRFF